MVSQSSARSLPGHPSPGQGGCNTDRAGCHPVLQSSQYRQCHPIVIYSLLRTIVQQHRFVGARYNNITEIRTLVQFGPCTKEAHLKVLSVCI
ncbi:hypothetical protein FKM82_006046 [Ascaphus truei]